MRHHQLAHYVCAVHARTGRVFHKAIKVLSIKRELRRASKQVPERSNEAIRDGTINEATKRQQGSPKNSLKEMQSKPKVISTISAKTCQMGRQAGSQLERAQPACQSIYILQAEAEVSGAKQLTNSRRRYENMTQKCKKLKKN